MFKISSRLRKLFFGNVERKSISLNLYWLFLEKVVRFLVGFFVTVWVTRYLGPERYGILNYALSYTSILGTFIGLGLGKVLIRELVKYPEKEEELLNTSLVLFLYSSITIIVVTIGSIYFLYSDDKQTIWLVVIYSISYIFRPFSIAELYFESKVKSKIIIPYTIGGLIISNLFKIYLVIVEAPLYAFAWPIVLECLVTALGIIYVYKKRAFNFKLNWKLNINLSKSLLKDSIPVMLSAFMILTYMKVDQIMLREMVSAEEVGYYSLAGVLSGIWLFIPMIITRTFFPKIVLTLKKDKASFHNQLQRLYKLVTLISYCIVIPFTFLSDHIVLFLYGAPYAKAGLMASFLVWFGLFFSLGEVRNSYIYAMNLTRQYLIITVISALLNIGLNLILIPVYQGFGAVLATLASQIFTSVLSCFLFKSLRTNGIMIFKAILNPFAI